METLADILGIIGVIAMLVAYFMLQNGTLSSKDDKYLWLNLLGASLVIISLFWAWNTPAFLIESAWVIISANSLIKKKRS